MDFVNPEGEKKPLKQCYVGGILLKYEEKAPYYQLPSGITLGESTLVQVTDKFGTPTDEYEEKRISILRMNMENIRKQSWYFI